MERPLPNHLSRRRRRRKATTPTVIKIFRDPSHSRAVRGPPLCCSFDQIPFCLLRLIPGRSEEANDPRSLFFISFSDHLGLSNTCLICGAENLSSALVGV